MNFSSINLLWKAMKAPRGQRSLVLWESAVEQPLVFEDLLCWETKLHWLLSWLPFLLSSMALLVFHFIGGGTQIADLRWLFLPLLVPLFLLMEKLRFEKNLRERAWLPFYQQKRSASSIVASSNANLVLHWLSWMFLLCPKHTFVYRLASKLSTLEVGNSYVENFRLRKAWAETLEDRDVQLACLKYAGSLARTYLMEAWSKKALTEALADRLNRAWKEGGSASEKSLPPRRF